jgi:hypothetical protein
MGRILTENLEHFNIENRNWQGIPSMDIDRDGILYASWYSGGVGEGEHNYVMLHKSFDNGLTFTSPVAVVNPDGNTRAYDPAVFTDPAGRVHWFWAESYGMYDGRCGVWESMPGDNSIMKPRRLSDGIMMNKPTVLKNGNWILPVSLWSMKPYFKRSEGPVEVENRAAPGSYSVISTDSGQSFNVAGRAIPDEPSCDEHMIVERNDGSLWMLIRVKYGLGESFSYDGGYSWSGVKPSSIKSPVSRFFIRRMSSGRLLLINHFDFTDNENLHSRRCNLHAMLSEDEGQTWPYKLLIDERDGVSYPDAAIIAGGRINIIYDRDRYGASEILTAYITENEILEGRIKDSGSYLKNVISSRIPLV